MVNDLIKGLHKDLEGNNSNTETLKFMDNKNQTQTSQVWINSIKTFEKLELLTLILRKKKQPKKSVKSSPNKKTKLKKTKLQLFENIFNLYMLRGPKINFSFETPSIYLHKTG